ncbi:MAG: hypothetical protein LBS19_13180 [Clostridiales bacterium]|jgi:hypothetical protein|nr:hypothetical protein [Clostridiales bacterium]
MYETMSEIERKYDGEWVFMTHCQKGEHHQIIGGVVAAHSKDKSLILDLWGKGHESKVFFRYVGSLPEGTSLLL